MKGPPVNTDDLTQKPRTLRERIAAFNAAVLRINATLDLTTVLQEVVDSARVLTGARCGVITTLDQAGGVQDFLSSGFSAEEHTSFLTWPEGPKLWEHFRDLSGPIRLIDLPAFVRSLGVNPDLIRWKTFQGAMLRHRGAQVGNLFLMEKESAPEFTAEDEEVLVLFASLAATAIANARTYRDERRARADLEALVETSPVGVVVMDAAAGRAVSFNREARRIMEPLRTAGRPLEELQDVITLQRANGRDVPMAEFPPAAHLGNGETVRAEEIVFSVPDGRSARTLVNATPIRSDDGAIASLVVTLQDLAPLDELERLRAEFLDLVSHELRAPLTSIRGSVDTLLEDGPKLDPAEMREFHRIIQEQAEHMRSLISDLLDAGRIEAGTLSVSPEPSEVAALVDRARNTFLSGGGRHTVLIDLPPDLPRVMADRRRIEQVLNNLLANAAEYSPESFPIRVEAQGAGVQVAISVADEGRGVAPERMPYLFRKHAGRAGGAGARDVSGTGLGLIICKGLVEAHGGRIHVHSGGVGQGTRITFTLPAAGHGRKAVPGLRLRGVPPDLQEPTRVLVVDDDPHTLRYVRDALAGAGYDAAGDR